MNTCDTCDWWSERSDGETHRCCLNPKFSNDLNAEHDEDSVIYAGCYEEMASMFTGPKFGCIHHKSQ